MRHAPPSFASTPDAANITTVSTATPRPLRPSPMISLSVLTPPASLPWMIWSTRIHSLDRFDDEATAGDGTDKVTQPENVEAPDHKNSGGGKDDQLADDARYRTEHRDVVEDQVGAEHDRGNRR